MYKKTKKAVYSKISGQKNWNSVGRAKIEIGKKIIHVRFCSTNISALSKYKFNINPNTLSADYELWVCGDSDTYYLVPIQIIKDIYNDPDAYLDNRHPGYKIVSIDTQIHSVTYARGGKSKSLVSYYNTRLND